MHTLVLPHPDHLHRTDKTSVSPHPDQSRNTPRYLNCPQHPQSSWAEREKSSADYSALIWLSPHGHMQWACALVAACPEETRVRIPVSAI